jgi:3',5'-cyclic AMP phosphodiesterase CpdA
MNRHFLLASVSGLWLGLLTLGAAETAPLLTFAAVADLQYADKEPGGTRFYRESPAKLRSVAADLNHAQPAFVIHLGDLTDGQPTPEQCKRDVVTIAAALKMVTAPWKQVLGNHDAKAGRNCMAEVLDFKQFHYEFTQPGLAGWRFVVLDGNDAGYGVFSAQQLDWFRGVLAQAKARQERVLCFCHYPLIKEMDKGHVAAKPAPVMKILEESGCVVAWMAGHDHSGGHVLRNGIHHLTLRGMIETKDTPAAAIIRLFPDHLSITGYGREPSRELPFVPAANAAPVALRPAA